jgi:hypothetical protein
VLAVRDRRSWTVLAAGTLGGAAFAYVYRFDDHIDRYTVVALAVTAAVAAASARLAPSGRPALVVRTLVSLALAIGAGFELIHNPAALAATPVTNGQIVIDAARQQTPDGAIIIAQWPDAAALGYGAYVEHVLGSRLLVTAWPNQYSGHYAAWTTARPVLEDRSFGPFGRSFDPVPIRVRR